jgi:hypothetical protein
MLRKYQGDSPVGVGSEEKQALFVLSDQKDCPKQFSR